MSDPVEGQPLIQARKDDKIDPLRPSEKESKNAAKALEAAVQSIGQEQAPVEPQHEPGLLLDSSQPAQDEYEEKEFYVVEEGKALQEQFSFGHRGKKEKILVAPALKDKA